MPFDAIGLALSLWLGARGGDALPGGPDHLFHPRERAVGDWRWQAAAGLDASPGTRAELLLGRAPAGVSRCVRLNNYWCIKRGGWSGEIASDAEGHVAFASAVEGATVAALLLRRYYVDYGRHSAAAIVSRWAPASCGGVGLRSAPDVRRGAPTVLARHGLGGTLRARWLASHGRKGAGFGHAGRGRFGGRASAVPDPLIGAALPAPAIALGIGAAPAGVAASLPEVLPEALVARPGPPPSAAPDFACAADALRVRNYAARAAAGIAASPEADLGLFDAAGRPTPHLARLMRNMAAVEIGPFGAGEGLVAAGVARAELAVAARRPMPPADRLGGHGPSADRPAASDPGAVAPASLDEARRSRSREPAVSLP